MSAVSCGYWLVPVETRAAQHITRLLVDSILTGVIFSFLAVLLSLSCGGLGVPLKPMLAKISEGVPDAIKQLKGAPFLAEYKYDGTRAQIHLLSDNSVKVFSRNCEDKTASMPDVVAAIQAAAKGTLPVTLPQCASVGMLT